MVITSPHKRILQASFPSECANERNLTHYCQTCKQSFVRKKIPTLCKFNGFKYPPHQINLPPLDIISERLICPRLPFMQIRRLRREMGTYKIIGQVINVPVEIEDMIKQLPRQLDDDFAFNVNIKRNILHKSTYLCGAVKKSTIKAWLSFMVTTPLYRHYDIQFNNEALNRIDGEQPSTSRAPNIAVENEEIECLHTDNDNEILLAQQQTMVWDESKYLDIAPAQNKQPLSIIYDSYAEELSFPAIYYGQSRIFKQGVKATPFNIASSEIRRSDRRGATPQHVLYMAAKIIRLRVSSGLHSVFKFHNCTANITRNMLENREFIEAAVEKNLSFFQSIPNSMQYWNKRKKDLFAMIRQLGKPTMFLTLSANEIRWPHLLKILYKFSRESNGRELDDPMNQLRAFQRASLVNEDPIICCIYFHKLVNVIMQILSSNKPYNPFRKYRVLDYFKRIEFQHRGSPHAHILLWLQNAPDEPISENMPNTVKLITDLCSVSSTDLPNTYSNQVHQHTFTCFKKSQHKCRFNIPYWPMDITRILLPLAENDNRKAALKSVGEILYKNLSERIYPSFQDFLNDNNMNMNYYLNVIRASIKRATVIYKRNMQEIWTNTFNPWIAGTLNSNMDFQFIIDEYSCAAYVVEYVNKSNRGISNLHSKLIELQAHHPNEDYLGLLKKVCINMINSVEMCCQEGAWYLLRQPMSESSREILFIPTMWPTDRHKTHKKRDQMDREEISNDSTDIWTTNILQKYESRPEELNGICLADFGAWYKWSNGANNTNITKRKQARVIRYVHFNMVNNCSEYKREMVTLFFPFRCEHIDILDHLKYLQLFDEHNEEIMRNFAKYEICDIARHIEMYNSLNKDLQDDRESVAAAQNRIVQLLATTDANNDDFDSIPTGTMTAIVRERNNVMSSQEFCQKMRLTNPDQRNFLLTLMNTLLSSDNVIQIFFTGAAGTGKTFTLNLAKEITNRFTQSHSSRSNAYVACASTGKAAVAIGGATVHSTFRIAISRRSNAAMSRETIQSYRNAFGNVKVIFIDEISMLSADILHKIHGRMCEITGNFDTPFGGINVIFCGDLRQLPPVNARPIFKPIKDSITGPILWQSLKFYNLTKVMRQSDIRFSNILTKIGNGEELSAEDALLIENRFRTADWCKINVPNAIRLFHINSDVDKYNLESISTFVVSSCKDTYEGYRTNDELVSARTKLHAFSVTECGGLPFILKLSIGKPYMITCNIDVEDGIVNGAIGIAKYIECDENDENDFIRVWLNFDNAEIGHKLKIKCRPLVASRPTVLSPDWTPITKRTAKISINNRTKCSRVQFPLSPASALTIHKSQGGSFDEVVFKYKKSLDQQMVYVALSRVTSIEGLYITNEKDDFTFYHKNGCNSPKMVELRQELERLQNYKLLTICDEAKQFLASKKYSFICVNTQSLKTHVLDIESDTILQSSNWILFTETWVNNNEIVNINNFKLICQYKENDVRSGGVSIYEHVSNATVNAPENISRFSTNIDEEFRATNKVGDICGTEIIIDNKKLLLAVVYIHPNTPFPQICLFLSRYLYPYSQNSNNPIFASFDLSTMPIILAGDFNLDVMKPENKKFLEFMETTFQLKLKTSITPTTLGNTCIDMVFSRNIDIDCHTSISYFSYHKPIIFKIKE